MFYKVPEYSRMILKALKCSRRLQNILEGSIMWKKFIAEVAFNSEPISINSSIHLCYVWTEKVRKCRNFCPLSKIVSIATHFLCAEHTYAGTKRREKNSLYALDKSEIRHSDWELDFRNISFSKVKV